LKWAGSIPKVVKTCSAMAFIAIPLSLIGSADSPPNITSIIEKSVAANNRDWQAQPEFSWTEHYIKSKIDSDGKVTGTSSNITQSLMIDESPYSRLIAVDNEPLNKERGAEEREKLKREIVKRRDESASARKSRIGKYKDERAEEHLLMQEMVSAFNFRLLGTEQMEGVPCYHLLATPKPDYKPPVEKARVLKGMRGQMWIDTKQYHWVKIAAEVTQPVTFGFFIAKVNPGTRFEVLQMPVDQYWLPKRFIQTVNASVFGIYGYRNKEETSYSDYKRSPNGYTQASLR
jgi:hypothetical protein